MAKNIDIIGFGAGAHAVTLEGLLLKKHRHAILGMSLIVLPQSFSTSARTEI